MVSGIPRLAALESKLTAYRSQAQRDAPPLSVAGGEPLVWGRRTYVMGVINLAPDSFSGDGLDGDVAGRR